MLHVGKLVRLVENERFGQVVDEVLRNGRPLPVAIRARLTDNQNITFAGLGLALQRSVELSYLAGAEMEHLAAAAVKAWESRFSGSEQKGSGESGGPAPAALAMLVAGLIDLLIMSEANGPSLAPGLSGRVRAAVRDGLYQLASEQSGTAARDPRRAGLVGDEMDSAVVLWQFAPRGAAIAALEAPSLANLERAVNRLELWRDPVCGAVLGLAHIAPASLVHGRRAAA